MFAKTWFRILLIVFLTLLPLAILAYRESTKLPKSIAIGGGPEKGLYQLICENLQMRIIEANPDVKVEITKTNGSLENLRLLREGEIGFGLYQPGAEEAAQGNTRRPDPGDVRFVANLYFQPAHLLYGRPDQSSKQQPNQRTEHPFAIGCLTKR